MRQRVKCSSLSHVDARRDPVQPEAPNQPTPPHHSSLQGSTLAGASRPDPRDAVMRSCDVSAV